MSLRIPKRGPRERQEFDRSTPWWSVHVARYEYAKQFVVSNRVLDVACGTGYGLNLLREAGADIVGLDLAREAILEARTGFDGKVVVADAAKLPFESDSFDVIVSFETIEHLQNRRGFVSELSRVLQEDGLLVLSTPNANLTRPVQGKPQNPFHVFEYTPEELREELALYFGSTQLLGQRLDTRFVVPPFWDDQERLRKQGRHAAVLLWRVLQKLPRRLGDLGGNLFFGHALVPGVEDYRFEGADVASAPVLIALCRNPSRTAVP